MPLAHLGERKVRCQNQRFLEMLESWPIRYSMFMMILFLRLMFTMIRFKTQTFWEKCFWNGKGVVLQDRPREIARCHMPLLHCRCRECGAWIRGKTMLQLWKEKRETTQRKLGWWKPGLHLQCRKKTKNVYARNNNNNNNNNTTIIHFYISMCVQTSTLGHWSIPGLSSTVLVW